MEMIRVGNQKIKLQTIGVIFCLLLFVVFFAFLFFRKGTHIDVVVKVGDPNYTYQVWRRNPSYGDTYNWFSQLLKPGMQEHDGLGRSVATVLKTFQYDSSPDTSNIYLTVKVKTTYSRGSGQYTFKGKPVLIGSEIKLILNNVLVNGTIIDVLSKKTPLIVHKTIIHAIEQDWRDNYLNTSGVPLYAANALNIGDTVYDSQQRPIITVLDKKTSDAQTTISTADGRLLLTTSPLLKDVTYTLELLTINMGGKQYLLGNIPVVIGQAIPIHTKTVSTYPIITDIVSAR